NGTPTETVVTPETKITPPEPALLSGSTVFYGWIERIGGAEPKVRLRRPDGSCYSLKVDKATARKLAQHLYSWVGLRGEASWDATTRKAVEFTVKGVVSYRRRSLLVTFEGLSDIAAPYYDHLDDPEGYFTELRHGE